MTASLIEKLKAATKDRRTKVTVLDAVAYATPLTLAGTMKASAKHPDSRALFHADTLVTNLTDEAGNPLFTSEDKEALAEQVAGDLLSDAINAIHGLGVAAQAKN